MLADILWLDAYSPSPVSRHPARVVSNGSSNEHADMRPDPLDQLDEPSRELPAQRYQRLYAITRWTGFE